MKEKRERDQRYPLFEKIKILLFFIFCFAASFFHGALSSLSLFLFHFFFDQSILSSPSLANHY